MKHAKMVRCEKQHDKNETMCNTFNKFNLCQGLSEVSPLQRHGRGYHMGCYGRCSCTALCSNES